MPLSLFLLPLALQITHTPPIVKGTGLPPADSDEGAVMAPVQRLLAGIGARDAAMVASAELAEGGGATIVTENADGTRTVTRRSWAEVNARFTPGPEKYAERLLDPVIETDGSVAVVWSPYVFYVDGKLHHCGMDHFDLVKTDGGWKIANLTWSSRTTGCDAQ